MITLAGSSFMSASTAALTDATSAALAMAWAGLLNAVQAARLTTLLEISWKQPQRSKAAGSLLMRIAERAAGITHAAAELMKRRTAQRMMMVAKDPN
jgi:hypothetical protein